MTAGYVNVHLFANKLTTSAKFFKQLQSNDLSILCFRSFRAALLHYITLYGAAVRVNRLALLHLFPPHSWINSGAGGRVLSNAIHIFTGVTTHLNNY